jgi:glyoxylase-like metal-dependent hydrolase (beta-lactamase superfamily II)/rhodanese-related sulfurtransferase
MYFQQYYLTCLAHASYLIASEGEAAVVDPQRDVELYLEEAAKQGFRIRHIIETHLHADFVSGHIELAARTGAKIYVGAAAGATFPHVAVREGDLLEFGKCRLKFLETPGHTVESITVLVSDLEKSPEPFAALTGDTLFIGDVGRPDLSKDKTPQELAGMLYDSLQTKLLTLPDSVEVYPAHGAGSLCGRQMRPERVSTIGRERETNYALKAKSREEFVRLLTAELPERPGYFALDAEINRTGAGALSELPPLRMLTPAEVAENREAAVLDTRPPAAFGAGHIPGSWNIPLGGQYASWAATLIGLDTPVILVAEDSEALEESRIRLARVGMEKVIGALAGGFPAWHAAGFPAAETPQISVENLRQELGNLRVIDVRRPAEYEDAHIEGALLLPLNRLAESLGDLDRAQPCAVHCKSGYRSAIAASILERAGFRNVLNVTGGFDAWRISGFPCAGAQAAPACSAAG